MNLSKIFETSMNVLGYMFLTLFVLGFMNVGQGTEYTWWALMVAYGN
jgi:hypothetical protein